MMKKMITLALVLVGALAVGASAGVLGVEAQAGLAMSTLDQDSRYDDPEVRTGLVAGLSVNYGLAPGIALKPGLFYVQQGTKYDVILTNEEGNEIGHGDGIYALDYVQVPVLVTIDLPVVGALVPAVVVGPTVSFKAAYELRHEIDGLGDNTIELDDGYNNTILGAIVGLRTDFGAGPASISVDLRYSHGFTSVVDTDDDEFKSYHRGWQLLAGYSF